MKKFVLAAIAAAFVSTPAMALIDTYSSNMEYPSWIEDLEGATKDIAEAAYEDGYVGAEQSGDAYDAGFDAGYKRGDQDLVNWIKGETNGLKPSQVILSWEARGNTISMQQDQINQAYAIACSFGTILAEVAPNHEPANLETVCDHVN